MSDRKAFFDHLRASDVLGPVLTQSEVTNTTILLDAMETAQWPVAWTAYGLATAYHETAFTMAPVRERGSDDYFRRRYDITGLNPRLARELGNLTAGDGVRYLGRGHVQLTGRTNYARAQKELRVPLLEEPDLALHPHTSARILIRGMEEGWFTTRKLADYLPRDRKASHPQFTAARRVVNGTDRAREIARYAIIFQEAVSRL